MGAGQQCLGGREVHFQAGQRERERHTPGVTVGVEVGRDRQRRPLRVGRPRLPAVTGRQQRAGVGVVGTQREGGAGQHDRGDPALGQRPGVLASGVQQVVGAGGAEFGRQSGTAAVRQFLGVDLRREPGTHPSDENVLGLGHRERPLLAEHVAEDGHPLVGDRRNLFLDDLAGVRPRVLVSGHRVGTHERRHHVNGVGVGSTLDRRQHPQFRLDVQSVAGLHLDRRRAVREHRVEVPGERVDQTVLVGPSDCLDGAEDAAALSGDRLVRLPA